MSKRPPHTRDPSIDILKAHTHSRLIPDTSSDETMALLRTVLSSVSLQTLAPVNTHVTRHFGTVTLGRSVVTSQDQKRSGRCWIFASVNVLRRRMIRASHLPPTFNLSHTLVYFYSMLEKCNTTLERMAAMCRRGVDMGSDEFLRHGGWDITDGGTCGHFGALVRKYGIVPQHVFPDNYQSQHSDSIGSLLTLLMKQACLRIFAANGDLTSCKADVMTHVHGVLCAFLGTPPGEGATFRFHYPVGRKAENSFAVATGGSAGTRSTAGGRGKTVYKSYTPLSFYAQHVAPHDADELVVTVDPRHPANSWIAPVYSCEVLTPEMDPDRMHQHVWARCFNLSSTREVKLAVLHSLTKARLPVVFMCDISHHFDQRLRLLAFEATPGVVQRLLDVDVWDMPKAGAYSAKVVSTNHAMTFIGYDADDDVWEVENSWGDKLPITMSGAWFDRFVTTVSLRKTDVVSTCGVAVRKALQKAIVPLLPNEDMWAAASQLATVQLI